MKRLIVSADDFGLTAGINEGIIRCARDGVVTSASIMANMPAFDDAVALAKQLPSLATGIHLNLVKGKPLLPPAEVLSLVDNKGNFYTLPRFTLRLLTGQINLAEAQKELQSQVEKARAAGLSLTHLDSHRHFHVYLPVLRLVIGLAKEYKIDKIRCPLGFSTLPASPKEFILTSLARNARRRMDSAGVRHNDRFFELVKIEGRQDYLKALARVAASLPDGVTELDCHPGFVTGDLNGIEAAIHNRERQIDILTDPALRGIFKQHQVELINYRDIA